MAPKTHHGSCHCGSVTFEADIDLSAGTGKCNCNSCRKKRWWSAIVKPEAFRITGGEGRLKAAFSKTPNQQYFCMECGVITHGHSPAQEWNGGESYSVNLALLDDISPEELIAAPMTYFDGLNDNWWNPPAEVRHL